MESTKFVRPLGNFEKVMFHFLKHDGFTVVYSQLLGTQVEICDEDMAAAIATMQKIFPNLRMGLREHEGEPWFEEMESGEVDYQRSTDNWEDVIADLANVGFRANNLLWRVRLVERGVESDEKFPYKYALVLNLFHAITDGTSNIIYLGRFADVIDAQLSKKTVDWKIYDFMPSMETLFDKDYKWSEIKPILVKALNSEPAKSTWATMSSENECDDISHPIKYNIFDEQTTAKLVQRCKEEKVTVNGPIVAAFQLAFYKEMKRRGFKDDVVPVSTVQAVNMRRFLENGDNYVGVMPGCIFHSSSPSSDTENYFWEYSREISKIVHDQLNDEDYCKSTSTVNTILFDEKKIASVVPHEPLATVDLTFSNLGDVDRYFSTSYDCIDVECLHRSCNNRFIFVAGLFALATTFRGRLHVNADCQPRFMDRETTERIFKEAIRILQRVADAKLTENEQQL